MHAIEDVQDLLAAAVAFGPIKEKLGMTEQPRRLKKSLLKFGQAKFADGKF